MASSRLETQEMGAAVSHQKWPASCGLYEDAQVEKLIEDHVKIMINGMLNSSRGKSSH